MVSKLLAASVPCAPVRELSEVIVDENMTAPLLEAENENEAASNSASSISEEIAQSVEAAANMAGGDEFFGFVPITSEDSDQFDEDDPGLE